MEDELWMRKIKERLDDYSEPLPVSGWERLEKELPASKPSVTVKRRIIPFRRWAVAAAAVLLAAVSSVSIWLLQSPVGEEVRNTSTPALAVAPDKLPEQQTPSVRTEITEPGYRAQGQAPQESQAHRPLLAQQLDAAGGIGHETSQSSSAGHKAQENAQAQSAPIATATTAAEIAAGAAEEEKEESKAKEVKETAPAATAEPTATTGTGAEDKRQVERRRPSGKDKLHLPVGKPKKDKSRGWSVGLAVGNTGGLISGNSVGGGNPMQGDAGFGYSGGRVDLNTVVNSIMDVPEGQELVFKNGMPYLMKNEDQVVDIDHKQPLSFGFSVRKGLARGFSVETGLTYTYLASDVKFAGNSAKVSQKLHYLGIPLRANWNFVDKTSFIMYVSAGGVMEKCIYGKIGSRNETVDPLQFSVMGAVGAQYNISRRVGIYVEPGVSYFFDDGSEIQTIRKENPCNFTLQGGIRLTY